jgi:hypothetical protein
MMRDLPEPMTIDQLKKHIDRLDRRVRKKADKADVRRLERRMDERFVAVGLKFDALEKGLNARIDSRFGLLNDKLTTILNILDRKYDHHQEILDVHERRLNDIDAPPRA